ncbi:sigma-70 family RNA polymerase sigma factor [Arenibacter sp. GZD96]|uniref:sigma-70 family RNA polymerase sigma factor n=1 Tax=Aurantibrevibacter litoralis TaxID=3106030 RepID=UPI002AFEF239|nr:sigma-70 family RNA polymerase sigma factor [Arenibacter sp. GZD-96]MEA1786740.1 sigma-70 family RNA polymerase sigma factor [Arenibacter sp. GZD-96]
MKDFGDFIDHSNVYVVNCPIYQLMSQMHEIIENWFHEYADDLFSWAYHKTSSKETSEDLVQETFLSAAKGFKNFKNNSNPKTWLFAILNNKIIDFYRSRAKSLQVDNQNSESSTQNLTASYFDADGNWKLKDDSVLWEEEVHILDNANFRKIMTNCMHELPENWRLAIMWKYLLNKSADQICQEIKVTQSNYWQIIHRAKLTLKSCIDQKWKF